MNDLAGILGCIAIIMFAGFGVCAIAWAFFSSDCPECVEQVICDYVDYEERVTILQERDLYCSSRMHDAERQTVEYKARLSECSRKMIRCYMNWFTLNITDNYKECLESYAPDTWARCCPGARCTEVIEG